MTDKEYYTSKEVQDIFRIHRQTLYSWRKKGLIDYITLGERKTLYKKSDIEKMLGKKEEIKEIKQKRKNVIYCRVSNQKQKNDLMKQKQLLLDFCNAKGHTIDEVYLEIASGMNEDREQFNKMIKSVLNHEVGNVFITFKDRLTRFGFKYFENIFKFYDCNIIILNNKINDENFEKELTNDIVSIIHHFSMKLYSNRRKQFKKAEKILEEKQECDSNEIE